MVDIRLKTCLIIKRGPWYLVGWNHFYHRLNWSMSCYDAWRTRDIDAAWRVAAKTGGELYLFKIPTMIILFLKEWRTMIMHLNSEENRLLAEFRDALLPKLMSGEIRVNE